MKKWVGVILILAAACLSLGQETVKIGVVLPMSGGVAAFGRMALSGIEIAHALFPEVLGKKIRLVILDDQSDRVETTLAVRRAIGLEGVIGILGPVTSGNSLVGGMVAEDLKVPMLTFSTNPMVTQGKAFVNRVVYTDPFQGMIAAIVAQDVLEAKSVAIFLDVEQDYSVGLASAFRDTFLQKPGNMVTFQYYRSGDYDFTPQLLETIQQHIEVIFIPGYYQEIGLIADQARRHGYDGEFIAGDGADALDIFQFGGDALEGVLFTTHFHPDVPVMTLEGLVFLEAFATRFPDRVPTAYDALGYDAYRIFLKAIEAASKTDPASIAQALRSIRDFPGATGTFSINDQGDAEKQAVIVAIEEGRFVFDQTLP